MTLEDIDMDDEFTDNPTSPPEESRNRTFLIVAGLLAAIIVLTIACLAGYALYYAPQQRNIQQTKAAEINAQNTEIARAAEQTAQAAAFSATPTQTPITATPIATATPVVAVPTEAEASPTPNPRTATVAALLTQAAKAQLTATPTAAGLPDTGFVEDVGVPGLLGLALALVVVIFLARRLRAANA